MTLQDKQNLKAIEAVETLREYCDSFIGCQGCLFRSYDGCELYTVFPHLWVTPIYYTQEEVEAWEEYDEIKGITHELR